MKIEHLRIKNLNSLYGEWSIDFTDTAFADSGIFAITGPTGAGKSTLLDGICLALYGRTPRLERINKSSNELMSRGTGECFAEVVFSSGHGRFCCHFSQHRARKKAEGRLAEAKHEIAEVDSGKVLAVKKREVARLVEHCTGMDFDRFTRSILLAQGGFAAFLQATPDKRAPVLEQLTGTKIYSDISRRVHERLRQEQTTLDIFKAEIQGISLLDKEEETDHVTRLKDLEVREQHLAGQEKQLAVAVGWIMDKALLKKELATSKEELNKARAALVEFADNRQRLQLGQRAAVLEVEFSTLRALRHQQQQELAALDKIQGELQAFARTRAALEKVVEKTTRNITRIKQQRQQELELGKRVRELDLRIKAVKAIEQDILGEQKAQLQQLKKHERERDLLDQKRAGAEKELAGIERYLQENSRDADLISRMDAIIEQMRQLDAMAGERARKKQECKVCQTAIDKRGRQHDNHQKTVHTLKQEHKQCQQKTKAAQEAVATHLAGRKLREYTARHEALQEKWVLLQRIATLEEDRQKLADGMACPLCGSTDHPWAEGNTPQPDVTKQEIRELSRFIECAVNLEEQLREQQQLEQLAAERVIKAEHTLELSAQECAQAARTMRMLQKDLEKIKADHLELQHNIGRGLSPFGVTLQPDSDFSYLCTNLKKRLQNWQQQNDKKQELIAIIKECNSSIVYTQKALELVTENQNARQVDLARHQQERQKLESSRKALYGSKDPDEQEKVLEKQLQQAEQADQQAQKKMDKLRQQITAVTSRRDELQKSTTGRKPELEEQENIFQHHYRREEFVDEAAFIGARLERNELEALGLQYKKLTEKELEVQARTEDRAEKLALLQKKNITSTPLESLHQEQQTLLKALAQLREERGAIRQILTNNQLAQEQRQTRMQQISAQQDECNRWQKLHNLIGSADGKKYRNFAQGITFELMVTHANRQLVKMTDRYVLVRDDNEPLELNVIDNYQAAEIRSTKNLSGGESFIVSLALALGLSKMAGRKTRVDSLFLDEGFGTLDEEALETALETLAHLNRQGKLIGIISHVPALKERIATRIAITPVSGGRSIVSGPGCLGP